jgi:thioredoxin
MWITMLIAMAIGAAAAAGIARAGKYRHVPLAALGGAFAAALVVSAVNAGRSSASPEGVASEEQFDSIVAESRTPVLVDFFATWCGPCKRLAPMLAELEGQYKGKVAFVRVDVDRRRALADEYGVHAYPTVVLLIDGKEAGRWVGVQARDVYVRALDEAVLPSGKETL